ncbi:MAG: MFS transporter [Pseudomonadota bacterium]
MPSIPVARTTKDATFSFQERVAYGVGSVGTGLYFSVPSVLLLIYMTDVLGIAPTLAAVAIFIPKLAGALFDPITGYLSDRTHGKLGRRLPWMMAGGLVIALCLFALFAAPFTGVQAFVYILLCYLLSSLAYSACAVPYLAIPAEVTSNPESRTGLISYRMILLMMGVLAGSALAPWLVEYGGGGSQGYRYMGAAIALLALFSFSWACWFAYRHVRETVVARSEQPLVKQLQRMVGNAKFMLLVMIFVLQTISTSAFTALLPFVATKVWGGTESLLGMLMLSFLIASMLGMTFWQRLSGKHGKPLVFVLSLAAYTLGLLSLLWLPSSPSHGSLLLFFALLGFVYAGTQLLPFAMVADVIFEAGTLSGGRNEGVFTGIWTACEKLGLSLGAPLAALVLSLAGYQESVGIAVTQTDETLAIMFVGFLAIPLMAQALSFLLLLHHWLVHHRHSVARG